MAVQGLPKIPYRPPSTGWGTPPFIGSLYQQYNPALANVTRLVNTTLVNGVTPQTSEYPWSESASYVNTFTPSGSVNLSLCRQQGFKNIQAVRQWHGILGFVDRTPPLGGVCFTGSSDSTGGFGVWYDSEVTSAAQTKYLRLQSTVYDSNTNASGSLTNGTGIYVSDYQVNSGSGLITQNNAYITLGGVYWNANSDQVLGPIGGNGHNDQPGDFAGIDPRTWMANVDMPTVQRHFGQSILFSIYGREWSSCAVTGSSFATGMTYNFYLVESSSAWTSESITMTFTNGGGSFSRMVQAINPAVGGPTFIQSVGIGNGEVTYYSTQLDSGIWPLYNTWIVGSGSYLDPKGPCTAILSAPNTNTDVNNDISYLLSLWNLADDGQYPPRTDSIWQIAPLMARDENQGDVEPITNYYGTVNDLRYPINDSTGKAPFSVGWNPTYDQMGWFDPNSYAFTWASGSNSSNASASALTQFANSGVILGSPGTTGQQDYFDFNATMYKCSQEETDSGTFTDWEVLGYGQWLHSVPAQLPPTATHWTNLREAMSKPPWAYVIQADKQTYDMDGQPGPDTDFYAQRADATWAQKVVVYTNPWPSLNFFGPGGDTKFYLDETKVCCVTGLSTASVGGTFTPTDHEDSNINPLVIAGGSVWGGASVNGFYDITFDTGTNLVTLGAKKYNLPSNWVSKSSDTSTCFGPLRWTSDTTSCPSLLGRAQVSVVNHTGSFSQSQPAFGMQVSGGEYLDFYDATMTLIASNINVTRLGLSDNPTQFSVGTNYTSSVYVMNHGANDYWWNDNQTKGDFVELDWTFDYRTQGEIGRLTGSLNCGGGQVPMPSPLACDPGYSSCNIVQYQGGLQFKPCCPVAVCISPNTESFSNAIMIGFPNLAYDDWYGSRWQCEIEEVMVPTDWQTPHIPCNFYGSWNADNGTCQSSSDTIGIYPYPPLVEARINVPTNGGPGQNLTAPTPSYGIGYLNPVSSSAGIQPPGAVSTSLAGYDNGSGVPNPYWTTWGYRINIEAGCAGGCSYNYVDTENLPCEYLI